MRRILTIAAVTAATAVTPAAAFAAPPSHTQQGNHPGNQQGQKQQGNQSQGNQLKHGQKCYQVRYRQGRNWRYRQECKKY
jgi:Spy/CpxP family protein refolding chaperone